NGAVAISLARTQRRCGMVEVRCLAIGAWLGAGRGGAATGRTTAMAGASAARPQDLKRRARRKCRFLAGATQSLGPNWKGALMSQRGSGYQRKLLDEYETPAWVTLALIPHLPEFTGKVWEPACGSGKMVAALEQAGFDVVGSDITQGVDFLGQAPEMGVSAIITNPPYTLAQEFIERALHFDDTRIVAMLLRTDFDHAASRAHLFADCATFAKKAVLTTRIRWFDGSKGSPSFNHCWMIWDRQQRDPPTLAYARGDDGEYLVRRSGSLIARAAEVAYNGASGGGV